MKRWRLHTLFTVITLTCAISAASPSADSEFLQGMASLQSNDFATGLHLLELAIADDPDNTALRERVSPGNYPG